MPPIVKAVLASLVMWCLLLGLGFMGYQSLGHDESHEQEELGKAMQELHKQ